MSVILAHPKKGSFNHAIASAAAEQLKLDGHEAFLHDLYEEKFDPVLPVTEIPKDAILPESILLHCREIAEADGIVIVHPNWWGQPPAILKGWIDRVIRSGVAYEFLDGDSGEGIPHGLLKAKAAIVFNTSNTEIKREMDVFGDPLDTLWKNCIFGLCGVAEVYRRMFNVVVVSTEKERSVWLDEVRYTVCKYFVSDRSRKAGQA
ncbi:MAG TPA: NAD(P)H-dependent oxidoreductase [Dissulfurispiraceae bacterium]|nr:NAD(P)H-dependent oxidoreductase [Dissulfurispiraceae bacterium]